MAGPIRPRRLEREAKPLRIQNAQAPSRQGRPGHVAAQAFEPPPVRAGDPRGRMQGKAARSKAQGRRTHSGGRIFRRESAAANEEGRFVAFLGCEWSAYTPDGGDRNVMYRRDEPRLRRSGRFFTEDVPDQEPDLETATEFLAVMRNEEVFINMHAGGRPTNLDFHEPGIETLAEIHSTHGTSDWFVLDALRRGYRFLSPNSRQRGRPSALAIRLRRAIGQPPPRKLRGSRQSGSHPIHSSGGLSSRSP